MKKAVSLTPANGVQPPATKTLPPVIEIATCAFRNANVSNDTAPTARSVADAVNGMVVSVSFPALLVPLKSMIQSLPLCVAGTKGVPIETAARKMPVKIVALASFRYLDCERRIGIRNDVDGATKMDFGTLTDATARMDLPSNTSLVFEHPFKSMVVT